MSNFNIFLTDEFEKTLNKISKKDRERINFKLTNGVYDELRQQPHFGANIKKLRNWKPETWRYRIGDYRLFYIIDEKNMVVVITTIQHRQSAYK